MIGNVCLLCVLLVGCTTLHAPRLVVRGYVTYAEGERQGVAGAWLRWVSVPQPVPQPVEPLPAPWPATLAGRIECVDHELCAWERRARLRETMRMRR